jgi:23S rRNA (pseudouridine1915-N3)-methyltransferase
MRKINIIHVGDIKSSEKYYLEAQNEYIKRLGAEFKIERIAIKDEPLPENPNQSQINACLEAEGKKILGKALAGAFKIALCVEGTKMTSEGFAALLYGEKAENCKSVDFIVGSSHGLSNEVKQSADFLLSMSDMTFSHRLAQVMLAEQLYRAYAIKTGKKYHK